MHTYQENRGSVTGEHQEPEKEKDRNGKGQRRLGQESGPILRAHKRSLYACTQNEICIGTIYDSLQGVISKKGVDAPPTKGFVVERIRPFSLIYENDTSN